MGETRRGLRQRLADVDPWLLAILVLATGLDAWHLRWGLPNGNQSWAADAIGPVTALGVARRTFAGFNSGWFYFKYPPAWPFIMVGAFTPYLAGLYASGGWSHPAAQYPYGFSDPQATLFALFMIARAVAVGFGVGLVALAYAIARRLFDRTTARWAAFLTATAYPIVYYAHTTNLDISYCFWLVLALYAAIVAAGTTRWVAWATLGAAAALALATKEQGFAWLVPLPLLVLAARVRADGWRALWARPTWVMAGVGLLTLLLANNALVNPLGFIGRVAYLLGRPLHDTGARLAPVEFALWKGSKEWRYVAQLWDGLSSSLGLPLLALAAIGALLCWRRPRAALWLWVPALALYYLSLRGLELITLRYLLPVTVVALIWVAVALVAALRLAPHGVSRWVVQGGVALVAALSLGRAVELDWLLVTDARYQAEAWMASNLPPQARAEVYQKGAFLPRFAPPLQLQFVPIGERTAAGLAARQPDAIVTSSASRKSITHIWTPDWRTTGTMLTPNPAATEFLAALESGALPYRLAAVFRQDPHLLTNRITSVAPEIRIYVRTS
ncbi:MAG: glycosyltransferase family 39 protein [Deltaproteobacteria bacterium]|nr:glycosyltransferase family 39 protein [Deltaproteobacteria bacterium]